MMVYKAKITFSTGSFLSYHLSVVPHQLDHYAPLPSQTLFNGIRSAHIAVNGVFICDNIDTSKFQVMAKKHDEYTYSLMFDAMEDNILLPLLERIASLTLDYAYCLYDSQTEYWSNYRYCFKPDSKVAFVIEENIPYSDVDTLLGENAFERLMAHSGNQLTVQNVHTNELFTVRALVDKVISL